MSMSIIDDISSDELYPKLGKKRSFKYGKQITRNQSDNFLSELGAGFEMQKSFGLQNKKSKFYQQTEQNDSAIIKNSLGNDNSEDDQDHIIQNRFSNDTIKP